MLLIRIELENGTTKRMIGGTVFGEKEIRIEEQHYKPIKFEVEADWSGASYWYAMAALSDECDLLLKGLRLKSLQGDSSQSEWFREYFGVYSVQEGNDVRLTKIDVPTPRNIEIKAIGANICGRIGNSIIAFGAICHRNCN